jgi:hypothetical protein
MATFDTTIVIPASKGAARVRAMLRKCASFPALMGALLVVANFGINRSLRLDPDTWMHIKLGQGILDTGHWPTGDIYSFTAHGVFRMAFEWGGEVLMALAYRLGGLRGLDLLLILLTSTVVLLLYYYAHLRCGNSKAAFLGAATALPLAAVCFTVRPQLVGFIFLFITLICLERYRQGRQSNLWVLPPLFLIWINVHGSFALGLFVFGAYWVSGLFGFSWGGLHAERWRHHQRIHLALVFLLSILVLPINPYGSRLVVYPVDMAFFQPVGVANVQEWQPIPFSFWQAKLLLLLFIAFIVAVIALRLEYRLEELGLFLFAAFSTFLHVRFLIFFAILLAPIAASILARWVPRYDPAIDKYALNRALMLLTILGMARYLPSEAALNKNVAKQYPVQAVEYLRHHPVPGPMFNEYGFGGYMLWAMGPEHKVFIDGRADLYEETGAFSDYLHIVNLSPDTFALLQSYDIQSCLVVRESPLATALAALPGWQRVYTDDVAALFVRSPKSGQMVARSSQ